MKLIYLPLLLCSIYLTTARVVSPESTEIAHAYNVSTPISDTTSEPTKIVTAHIVSPGPTNITSDPLSRVTKTIIKDLEAIGYTWRPGNSAFQSYLWWGNTLIDALTWIPENPNMLEVNQAWNRDLDKNPNKVMLRDIILSWWVYRIEQNFNAADIEFIKYTDVVEDRTRKALKKVYKILGKDISEDERNLGDLMLSPYNTPGTQEAEAWDYMKGHCPFLAGANKMIEEYTDFAGRSVTGMLIQFTGGVGPVSHFNAMVSLSEP